MALEDQPESARPISRALLNPTSTLDTIAQGVFPTACGYRFSGERKLCLSLQHETNRCTFGSSSFMTMNYAGRFARGITKDEDRFFL